MFAVAISSDEGAFRSELQISRSPCGLLKYLFFQNISNLHGCQRGRQSETSRIHQPTTIPSGANAMTARMTKWIVSQKLLTTPPKSRCLRRLGRGEDSRTGTRFSQAVDVSQRDRLASNMSCYLICIQGTHGPKCRIILLNSLHEVCDEALATDRRREVIGTGIVDLYLPEPATFDRTNAWQTVKVAAAH